MAQPRTSPLAKYPTRPARGKHALQSRRAHLSIPGYNTFPGYLKRSFPGHSRQTYKAMENALERYLTANPDANIPTPPQLTKIFEGLI